MVRECFSSSERSLSFPMSMYSAYSGHRLLILDGFLSSRWEGPLGSESSDDLSSGDHADY